MNSLTVYLVTGLLLWMMGLQGLLVSRQVLRRVIALNLMSSGVFMVMVTLAMRTTPPWFNTINEERRTTFVLNLPTAFDELMEERNVTRAVRQGWGRVNRQ